MKSLKIQCVGYEIAADWYDGAPGNNGVVLVLVGYGSSKANYHELTTAIVEKTGKSALVIDYSGHGESPYVLDGLTPAQNFLEVIQAYDWLVERYAESDISVMGTSYGGFLAISLVQFRSPKKLILRVPAVYTPEAFYTKWKDMDLEEVRKGYRTEANNFVNHPLLANAAKYNGQSYVLTHELDQDCPKPSTDAIAQAFGAETWEAKGFVHSLGKSSYTPEQLDEYQSKIADWLLSE